MEFDQGFEMGLRAALRPAFDVDPLHREHSGESQELLPRRDSIYSVESDSALSQNHYDHR